jgi:two-component system, OmpR family, phosphate regulon sensor histidine kinase PhoR
MRISALTWIIVLMGVSLLGLIGFQLYWIDSVVKANEERFQKDVVTAMNNVAVKLEQKEAERMFRRLNTAQRNMPKWELRPVVPEPKSPQKQPTAGAKASTENKEEQGRHQRSEHPKDREEWAKQMQIKAQEYQQRVMVVTDSLVGDNFRVMVNFQFDGMPFEYHRPKFAAGEHPRELFQKELDAKQIEIDQLESELQLVSRKYQMTASVLEELLVPSRAVMTRFNTEMLDSLLKSELADKGIQLDFNFGVMQPDLIKFVHLSDPKQESKLSGSTFKASLFPNDVMGDHSWLVVDFPGKSRYLLEKIWVTMVSSVVLVCIIVFCFGYSIRVILRQKKLSMMKSDFINNMTHEFKTPIATISLATEALRDEQVQKTDNLRDRYLKVIGEENKRLGSQVERVLQMAAMDKQDLNLKMEVLDVHRVIEELIENVRIQVESRGGRINVHLNAEIARVKGDETHLGNCVLNLLDNANKYSPEEPNITLRTENRDGNLIISVADRGMGMTRETLKHIFEKFYRMPTGNLHNVKGFGLGLSYVKTMAEAHQGTVSADSTIGKGSTFTLTLPLHGES